MTVDFPSDAWIAMAFWALKEEGHDLLSEIRLNSFLGGFGKLQFREGAD